MRGTHPVAQLFEQFWRSRRFRYIRYGILGNDNTQTNNIGVFYF